MDAEQPVPVHSEGLVGTDGHIVCTHVYISFPCAESCHKSDIIPGPAAQAQVQLKCVVFLSNFTQKRDGHPKGQILI